MIPDVCGLSTSYEKKERNDASAGAIWKDISTAKEQRADEQHGRRNDVEHRGQEKPQAIDSDLGLGS